MIQLIIPSFDRASQLDCFLRSLLRYWDYRDLTIRVLYKYSSPEYEKGYYKVFEKYPNILPSLEYDFCSQIKQYINSSLSTVIGFATDDCVCYREPGLNPKNILEYMIWHNYLCASLRLGVNTIVQNYLTGELQRNLQYSIVSSIGEVINWNWRHYPRFSNYGYMFSWDMHFYNKEWLQECIDICYRWENPRAFEHQMNTSDKIRANAPNMIFGCKNSSIFVNTINAVQNNDIPAGTKYNYNPKTLNDKFLKGEIISLRSFDNIEVVSSHEEVPLIFEAEI